MGQMGFFGIAKRYAGLDAKIDPLVKYRRGCSVGYLASASGGGVARVGRGARVAGGTETVGCGGMGDHCRIQDIFNKQNYAKECKK